MDNEKNLKVDILKKKIFVLWWVIIIGIIRLNVWFIIVVREWLGWWFVEYIV